MQVLGKPLASAWLQRQGGLYLHTQAASNKEGTKLRPVAGAELLQRDSREQCHAEKGLELPESPQQAVPSGPAENRVRAGRAEAQEARLPADVKLALVGDSSTSCPPLGKENTYPVPVPAYLRLV